MIQDSLKATMLQLAFKSLVIAGCQSMLLSGCITASAFNKADEEAQIAKIENALMTAKSGADMVPYLDPKHTFIWDVVDRPRYGVQDVAQHIDEVLATPQFKNFKPTLVHVEIEAGPNVAYANSIQHLVLRDADGKVFFESDYRVTNTYHKVNSRWLVVGEHLSFPVDLATGKAVFGAAKLPPGGYPAN